MSVLKVKVKLLSRVRLFVTPWTVAYQAPQSTEFSRQEYWSGLPFPSPCVSFSHVQIFVTPWTVALQAPLFMEFSRQEYWSGLPCPSPGVLPDSGIKSRSPALQADSFPFERLGKRVIYHLVGITAAAKSLPSCPTLCDPIDGSPSGSPVPGILQARTLEWAAISFSSA